MTTKLLNLEKISLSDSEIKKWESGELGNDEEFAQVVTIKEIQNIINDSAKEKLRLISIRLPVSLIEDLKEIAGGENLGYQTLIKIVLQRFVDAEFRKKYNQLIDENSKLNKEIELLQQELLDISYREKIG